jgi:hypothetical protein
MILKPANCTITPSPMAKSEMDLSFLRLSIYCMGGIEPKDYNFCYEPLPVVFPPQLALRNANLNRFKLNRMYVTSYCCSGVPSVN